MQHAPSFAIVVGSQRSGTTLTAQILGAHSRSIVIDEDDGLYTWTNALFQSSDRTDHLLQSMLKNSCRKYATPDTRFHHRSEISDRISYLILKAPNLTYSWKELANTIPHAKIIYLERNVRAIVASMMRLSSAPILVNQTRLITNNEYVSQRFSKEVHLLNDNKVPDHVKMALVALIKMSFTKDFQNAGFDLININYENLVDNPEKNIKSLLHHLGLEYEPQCANYAPQYQGLAPGLTDRKRAVDRQSVAAWKQNLSAKEQKDIDEVIQQFNSE